MGIRAILIDDEEKNLDNLGSILKQYCPVIEVLATAKSVKMGLEAIAKYNPALVFLDIQLGRETGFNLLEKIGKVSFEIIFITAYDQYALKAIKFCALDYLLKPINIPELQKAVDKAGERLHNNIDTVGLKQLIENLQLTKPTSKKIAIPTTDKLIFVKVDEIIQCIGDNNYTKIILVDGTKHLVSKTLKEYEELLVDSNFLRIHQSHLINLAHVKTYIKSDGGHIVMIDGSTAIISRQKKEMVLKRLVE